MSSIRNPLFHNTLFALRRAFKKNRAEIWRATAAHLSKSRSRRVTVNVGKISRLTTDGELVVVPGNVLGAGLIEHNLTVGAFGFSQSAKEKIRKAGGQALSLVDFVNDHPTGKGVKLIGG